MPVRNYFRVSKRVLLERREKALQDLKIEEKKKKKKRKKIAKTNSLD